MISAASSLSPRGGGSGAGLKVSTLLLQDWFSWQPALLVIIWGLSKNFLIYINLGVVASAPGVTRALLSLDGSYHLGNAQGL